MPDPILELLRGAIKGQDDAFLAGFRSGFNPLKAMKSRERQIQYAEFAVEFWTRKLAELRAEPTK